MKGTVLGHGEVETMLRIGRELQERLGFFGERERAGRGEKEGTEGGREEQMEKP